MNRLFPRIMKRIGQHPYWAAGLLSLLFSLITFYPVQPPNPDGFLYLTAAHVYLQSGYHGAYQVYNWLLYPILIAWLHQISGLDLLKSAYFLDAILSMLLVLGFVRATQIIYQRRCFIWLGILTILVLESYAHMRGQLIRDHGYWAFSLMAIGSLLLLSNSQRYKDGILWGIFSLLATLFRVEGAAMLLLAPLGMFLLAKIPFKTKLSIFFKANLVIGILFLSAIPVIWQHLSLSSHHNKLMEVLTPIMHPIYSLILPAQSAIAFIQPHFTELGFHTTTFVISGIIGLIIVMPIIALNPIYAIFVGYGLYHRVIDSSTRLLYWLCSVNILIITIFTFKSIFLEPRYTLLLCLILMLWIPGAVHHMYHQFSTNYAKPQYKKIPFLLACIGFLYLAIASLGHFGTSKTYLVNASHWLKSHRKENTWVITNDNSVAFLSRLSIDQNQRTILINPSRNLENFREKIIHLADKNAKTGTVYVAIKTNKYQQNKIIPLRLLSKKPVSQFQNKKGDVLLIFVINQHT